MKSKKMRLISQYSRYGNCNKKTRLFELILLMMTSVFFTLPVGAARVSMELLESEMDNIVNQPLTNSTPDSGIDGLKDTSQIFENYLNSRPLDKARNLALQGLDFLQNGEADKGLKFLKQAWELDSTLKWAGIIIAMTYLEAKEYDSALIITKKLQENLPNEAMGYTLAGVAYSGLKEQGKSEAAFLKALELNPGNPSATGNLASMALEKGNIGEAKDLLKAALVKNPDHLYTMLRLARLEITAGNLSQAEKILEDASSKHPESLLPQIQLSRLFLASNNAQKAIVILEAALQQFPDNPGLLELTGIAQLNNGMLKEAMEVLKSTIRLSPDSASPHYYLARVYEKLKQDDQAMQEIEIALNLSTNDPAPLLFLLFRASLTAQIGQLDSARNLLEKMTDSYPGRFEISELEGRIALVQKRPSEAILLFKQAIKNSKSKALTIQLANAQVQNGEKDVALSTLKKWLKDHPSDNEVRITLANQLLNNAMFGRAKSQYVQVVRLQPDNAGAWNNLAWLLAQEEKFNEALDYATKAHDLAPSSPQVKDTLGVILLRKGQHKKAVILLQSAAEKMPNNFSVNFHLAQAFVRSERFEDARRLLKKLLNEKSSLEERQKVEALRKNLENMTTTLDQI